MQGTSGLAAPAEGVWQIAGTAWRGLVQAVAGPEPSVARRWRPPGQRWAARTALGLATLALCAASLASLNDGDGLLLLSSGTQDGPSGSGLSNHLPPTAVVPSAVLGQVLLWVLVALAVVAPLLVAIRYPLLGWRIGWLGLLLVPLLMKAGGAACPGTRSRYRCCWRRRAWPGSGRSGRCCAGCGR
ncbi:MAG TPA: hypothetical protein VHT26_16980 [Trebonia sp.]|nr:hypothetical protein [Trebonia sp.]